LPSPRGPGENPFGNEPWRSRPRSLRSTLGGERLEPIGDGLDGAPSAAVGGLPLAALEPTLAVDEASLAEVTRGEVSELTPETTSWTSAWLLPLVATRTVVTRLPEAASRISGAATSRPMRVTWLTESPRLWLAAGAVWFFVLLLVLLRIFFAPPVV
jgi:hypothetical protein